MKSEERISFPETLRLRTKEFALASVRLYRELPRSGEAEVIGRQLLRSATSVAANYRAAGRARSKVEFTAKIGITVEEADEAAFWLELLMDAGVISAEHVRPVLREAKELVAIFAAAHRTARKTKTRRSNPGQTMARSPDRPMTR